MNHSKKARKVDQPKLTVFQLEDAEISWSPPNLDLVAEASGLLIDTDTLTSEQCNYIYDLLVSVENRLLRLF